MNTLLVAEINECSSDPCQHEGVCTDSVNSYSCTCVAGFTGQDCEASKSFSSAHTKTIMGFNLFYNNSPCNIVHMSKNDGE